MQTIDKTLRPDVVTQTSPEEQQLYADRRPNGEAMATIVAAGIGVFALGLLVVLVEMFPGFKTFLAFNTGVGPLSGKTIGAVAIWLVSWAVLLVMWKDKTVDFAKTRSVGLGLLAAGILLTFPLIYQMFTAK